MKIVKALLATIGIFCIAGFLAWIENQGTFGLILLLVIIFSMVFLGMYYVVNK